MFKSYFPILNWSFEICLKFGACHLEFLFVYLCKPKIRIQKVYQEYKA